MFDKEQKRKQLNQKKRLKDKNREVNHNKYTGYCFFSFANDFNYASNK